MFCGTTLGVARQMLADMAGHDAAPGIIAPPGPKPMIMVTVLPAMLGSLCGGRRAGLPGRRPPRRRRGRHEAHQAACQASCKFLAKDSARKLAKIAARDCWSGLLHWTCMSSCGWPCTIVRRLHSHLTSYRTCNSRCVICVILDGGPSCHSRYLRKFETISNGWIGNILPIRV